ncbi:MAG: ATP synthase F1 subunit gamma [Candidatus Omnitrophica bacterium]|nr:ATP synthase F1 subunit gamma [Candidatus Omnitrophota bacterium]
MASIKEFNNKLKSLKNTKKITRTMKMVAASKLRRAQEAQSNAKLYAQGLAEMTARISAAVSSTMHPLLVTRPAVNNVLILVITSDRGLCGAFNNNANKRVFHWVNENRKKYQTISLSFCGRRGYQFFKKKENVRNYYEDVTATPKFETAKRIGEDIVKDFIDRKFDEVYTVYNHFLSPISQKTVFEKVLPIDPAELVDEKVERPKEYIFEPEAEELLEFLIPHYLYFKIYFSLLENSAGEHGARMAAMDNATKNASDMINRYTLLRNRARQASITTELIEIVAGAEAIK